LRSRLAPSPTGALHLGNARTFLLNWLHVRAAGGTLLLRIDDLDGPRVKQRAVEQGLHDLRWMGLDWDENEGVLVQSERADVYDAAAQRLLDEGAAFPCVCTRREIEEAASAPHGHEGPAYPGTCDGRFDSPASAEEQTGRPAALRFRCPPGPVGFDDLLRGPQSFDPAVETGAFPIRKSNGTAAYQLATVVDDAASGVDLVIRGDDLLSSTSRQILLQQALGLPTPRHLHLPLVVGADGRRLAKRHGDTRVATYRDHGVSPERLVGFLAWTAGLAAEGEEVSPARLVGRYDPAALGSDRIVLESPPLLSGPDAL
jgi:glutamyl-tRNA synthetase